MSDIESKALGVDERVAYLFRVPPGGSSTCSGSLDTPGDGLGPRLFAGDPNPFSPSCGPAPDPMCWPSDHDGVEADIGCE